MLSTYIHQIGFNGLAIDGGGDVVVAIGPLVFFELAQALIETFDLFSPVNIFNLQIKKKNGQNERGKRRRNWLLKQPNAIGTSSRIFLFIFTIDHRKAINFSELIN